MLRPALEWLGFVQPHRDRHHGHHGGHGHTHGVVDPSIASTERGVWAVKWSFAILAVTAALQLAVVLLSGSVALLADTIHNVGDATTAIPLWIAFRLARRRPSPRFTYGYGRVEDLAGIAIVLIILASAIVAGWEAIDRLLHPRPLALLWAVVGGGVIGFVGNEAVAVFRVRVGREIDSAALVADGYHARADGLTSLAVMLGALGVWLGFPLADPVVGLVIAVMILGIVWQSGRAVLTRMLDGVDPEMTEEIRHAAEHVPGIRQVRAVRARWLGHRLHAEAEIEVDGELPAREAAALAERLREEAREHLPQLEALQVGLAAGAAASRP